MKIKITLAFALLTFGAFSQNAYFNLSAGYGLASSPDYLGDKITIQANGDYNEESILGSIGVGLNIDLGGGYMFNDNVGFDLGINALLGSKVLTNEFTDNSNSSSGKREAQTTQVRINPSLLMTTANDGLNVYGKAGLVIPVYGNTKGFVNDMDPTTTTTIESTSVGAFSLGYSGAIGVSYPVGDKLSIFGEARAINLRVKQGTMKIDKYEVVAGGQTTDVLATLSTSQIETEYVDSVSQADNTDPNQPAKALAETRNFNAVSISVGVKFSL